MSNRSVSVLLVALGILVGGCNSAPNITAGMTVAECRNELKHDLVHQFTTEHAGEIVTCYSVQPPHDFEPSYILFHDNALTHVGDIPPFERVVNYLDGRPISSSRPQTDTLVRLSNVIADEAGNVILPRAEHPEYGGTDSNLGPLPYLMAPLYPLMAAQELIGATVEGLGTPGEFNTKAIRPGVSREQVHAALGTPQKVKTSDHQIIDLYGRTPDEGEGRNPPFHCVAITYRNDVVEHVLSNDFIDVEWLN